MNLTVIIPVHEFNDTVETYLKKAIKSIETQQGIAFLPNVLIVCTKEIKDQIENTIKEFEEKLKFEFSLNEGKTDFQSQINLGVKSLKSDYFSILEFDDEYSVTYFKNIIDYKYYHKDVDFMLPIIIEVNEENSAIQLTNQLVWSRDLVGENGVVGFLNTHALEQYTNFKISGGVFNKVEFESIGGLKSNIKLAFNYEIMLRMLNNGSKIFVLPKIGYKHVVDRENSLFDVYKKTMSQGERKYWFEMAKKESNFFNDRIIAEYEV